MKANINIDRYYHDYNVKSKELIMNAICNIASGRVSVENTLSQFTADDFECFIAIMDTACEIENYIENKGA
jgi:hypothetical protein